MNKLDQEILKIAQDYQSDPRRKQVLADWYGGYMFEVPQYARFELTQAERKAKGVPESAPLSDEEYKKMLRRFYGQSKVPRSYMPMPEHTTAEYRLAWEGWLLAPLTTRYKAFLIENAMTGLKDCATDDSIPVLMAFVRQVDDKSPNPRIIPGVINYIAGVFHILIHKRSGESLLAALQIVRLASDRSLSLCKSSMAADSQKNKLFSNRFEFIHSVSGYFEAGSIEKSGFLHKEGRLFLPVIDELLNRIDVSDEDRAILQETKGRILKYAPER